MKAFWAKSWHIILAVLAFVGMILGFVLRGLFENPSERAGARIPDVPKPLQDKVKAAEEKAMVEKAKAKVTAESDTATLENISKIKDDKARRARLAEFLNTL